MMYELRVDSCRPSWIAVGLVCAFASMAFGEDTKAIETTKLLGGLNSPQDVAIRPEGSGESYEVFVAEIGAGRVVKILSSKPEKRIDVIAGFSNKRAKDD